MPRRFACRFGAASVAALLLLSGLETTASYVVQTAQAASVSGPSATLSASPTSIAPNRHGHATAITFAPTSLTFATQVVSTSSAAAAVMATNSGKVTETISGITLTGTNSGDYSQTNNCPRSLAVGASCTIKVT